MPDPNNAGTSAPAAAANANAGNNGAAPNSGANNQGGDSKTVPLAELMQEREKRQAMQTELEALKATVQTLANGANNNAQPASRPQPDPRVDLENLWREDPRKAMQAEILMAMNWRDQVESSVDSAVDQASKKYNDFSNYSADVRHYLRQLPADQRSKPGVVDAAYFMVKGQKANDLIEAEVKARMAKLTGADGANGVGAGGSSGGGTGQPKTTVLNADQKRVAAAMGVSEEEYLKHMR